MAPKVAKVFKCGPRSQAVRIPREFHFDTDEVFIERKGDSLVLTPKFKPIRRWKTWAEYWKNAPRLSDDFPDEIEDTPIKQTKPW